MNSYASTYDASEWGKDCVFTKMLYSLIIEIRTLLNDTTNINYKA